MNISRYYPDNPDYGTVNEANHEVGVEDEHSGAPEEREVVPQHEIQASDRVHVAGGRDLALREQVRQEFPNLRVNTQVVRENIISENSFDHVVDMLDSNEALIKSGPRISCNQISWDVVRDGLNLRKLIFEIYFLNI